jgi:hopanoid biosynthesis associated protein HpnK
MNAKDQSAATAEPAKRLVVNADDFGLSESVNRGILVAHRDGILTSASLLATGRAFASAVASAHQFPDLSVGVHLNVSEGTPVSSAARVATLVNERGNLHLSPVRLAQALLRRQVRLADILSEFRAQTIKVLDAGITPTHLDGHLHVHVLPQISPIVIAVAREFGIRYVRCPAEDLETTLPLLWKVGGSASATLKRSVLAYAVSSFARRFKGQLQRAGLVCADSFYGLTQTGFLDTEILTAVLARIPNGVTELMCHPGYFSAEVESLGGELTQEREREVLALTAPEVQRTVALLGIHLASFRDLQEALADSVSARDSG